MSASTGTTHWCMSSKMWSSTQVRRRSWTDRNVEIHLTHYGIFMGIGSEGALLPFFSMSLLSLHFGRCFEETLGVLFNRDGLVTELAEEDHSFLVGCFIK